MKHCIGIALIFIATWTAEWYTPTSCEEVYKTNPLNGEPYPIQAIPAIACFSTNTKKMRKEFQTKKEADDFFKACYEFVFFGGVKCSEIKIVERNL